ncbi:amidase family protein [Pandoraea terrae]|nr:amidase family protein [Pandoraea terrae]
MKMSQEMQTPFALEEATIADVHAAMRERVLTARQLVQGYLDRIEAYDRQGPCINSILEINPAALAEADLADAAPDKRGPLHGVPVLIKDNIETHGLPTTAGSTLLKDHVPRDDAFIVRKLREAGAIVLAKTNLHELASGGETVSTLLGQTRNPYDLNRTPGGSSGGTAAGIAANFGLVGIGTDGVNSIRSPASANNLVGLRPTLGLVSRTGLIPSGLSQDMLGPITRTVTDAAIVLDVIAGADPDDPSTHVAGAHQPPTYTAFLDPDGLQGARIGVLKSFFGREAEHQEVNAVIEWALEAMAQRGATLVVVNDHIDPDTLLSTAMVHHYEMVRDLDAYLTRLPPGFGVSTLADLAASGQVHRSVQGTLATAMTMATRTDEYHEHLDCQAALRQRLLDLMGKHALDVLAFPHQRRLVVPIGQTQVERNGVLASATGFPSIAIPAGFSAPTASAPLGVPVGMELFGRPFAEALLIRLAYAAEQTLKARRAPEATPPL